MRRVVANSKVCFLVVALLVGAPVFAIQLSGKVIRIKHGSRFLMVDSKQHVHTVTIAGIQTPEPGQAFFESATKSLKELLLGQSVSVDWHRLESSCRRAGGASCPKIGKVFLGYEDIGLVQVRRGVAWHDKPNLKEQSTTDKVLYATQEENARLTRIGMWKLKDLVPPWEYRVRKRALASKPSTKVTPKVSAKPATKSATQKTAVKPAAKAVVKSAAKSTKSKPVVSSHKAKSSTKSAERTPAKSK